MKYMKASEIRQSYLDFFASKGHKKVPSSSLVPYNDNKMCIRDSFRRLAEKEKEP